VKYFCSARNANPNIQDIKIINVFHDGVSNLKTVEEITMKKPKTVANLLMIIDVCTESSKARTQLLEFCGKGPSKKRRIGRSTQLTEEIVKIAATAVSM
jgi:hypothetical protein